MGSLKKKIVLTLTLVLSILIGSFAGILLLNQKNKIFAASDPEPIVAKVKLYENNNKYYVLYNSYDKAHGAPVLDTTYYIYDSTNNELNQADETIYTKTELPDNTYTLGDIVEKEVDLNNLQEMEKNPFLKDDLSGNNIIVDSTNNKLLQPQTFIQYANENDNIFMLKNANFEQVTSTKQYNTKEFVLVQFKANTNKSATLLSLSVNIKLTNYKNEILEINPGDYTTSSQTQSSWYSQLFDLTNIKKLARNSTTNTTTSTKIDEFSAQGIYDFVFTYNLNVNGNVTVGNIESTSFYMLSENYYINPNYHGSTNEGAHPRDNIESSAQIVRVKDKDNNDTPFYYNGIYNSNVNINHAKTEPRVYNVERIDKQFYEGELKSEKDYFYYSNFTTVDYNGNLNSLEDSQHIQYPTITYDASRYNFSYAKTMYGITTFVTTSLDTSNALEPKLVINYNNPSNSWVEYLPVEKKVNIYPDTEVEHEQYIASIQFNEIGKYVLSVNFVLGDTVFAKNSNDATEINRRFTFEKENWNLIHSYELTVFGYQLMHSEYKNQTGATEKEMAYVDQDISKSIFANVTNSNEDFNGTCRTNIDLTEETVSYPVNLLNGKLAKTNQAPLFFKYYAQLKGSISERYFYYYSKQGNLFVSAGSNNVATKRALTSNTRFTDNGLYVVCLTYEYADYDYLLGTKVKSTKVDPTYQTQIFIFEIENIEPKVDFYQYGADDYENKSELLTGGYTNKIVEINWEETLNNPFDVKPNVIVFRNEFDEHKNDLDYAEVITNNMSPAELEKLQRGIISVSKNGFYTVIIEYGPCTYAYNPKKAIYEYIYSASVVTNFTIDKENIGEGENIVEFYEDGSGPLYYENGSRKILDTQLFTNKRFAIIYGTIDFKTAEEIKATQRKRSGAKISVSYTFMPINLNNDFEAEILNNGKIIPNGAVISTRNDGVAYNSTVVENVFKPNTVALSSDGIYIFTFEDEAGNTYIRRLVKDTTSPALLQKINGKTTKIPSYVSGADNIVNLDTEIIWGENKGIKLDVDANTLSQLNPEVAGISQFDIYSDGADNYLLVKINGSNQINKSITDKDESKIQKKGITIYYKNENNRCEVANDPHNISTNTSYTIKAQDEFEKNIKENEHLFKIAVFDQMGNAFTGKVEMLFDKSALRALVSGQPQKNVQIINSNSHFDSFGDSTEKRLNVDGVSNKKNLYFSWIDGAGELEITSIQCMFYPLTFELKNNDGAININYPYSSNYTRMFELTTEELVQEYSQETNNGEIQGVERTKLKFPINALHDARFDGDTATVAGMYVIQRTYKGFTDETVKMEDQVRLYTFYIDRNNLISTENKTISNNHYVGETISLKFGDYDNENNSYTFSGKDFLQDFVVDEIFTTNRQPGKINDSNYANYKYSFNYNAELDGDLLTLEEFEQLNDPDITKININRIGFEVFDGEDDIKKAIDIFDNNNHFNGAHSNYYIIISDQNDEPINKTSLEFSLGVNLTAPQASFVENENWSVLAESQSNYISKNSTNVSLTWNIDDKKINSQINENDITITQIFESGRKVVLYSDKDSINRSGVSKIVHSDAENTSLRYINFEDFSSVINKEIGNCRIEIVLKYLTNTPQYYGDCLTTTKIIYFDYEKPQHNFSNLYNSDNYLPNINESKEEFEDYSSVINFENYAFIVDSEFSFELPPKSNFWQKDLLNVETNLNELESIWYRKYDKYKDDTGINQQSLVPGDPRYNKTQDAPTRLNFNPNLYITQKDEFGQDVFVKAYTEIYGNVARFTFPEKGCYYEVIEKDCADNYRVYTVYVLSDIVNEEIVYKETSIIEGQAIPTDVHLNLMESAYFEINNLKAEFFAEDTDTNSKGFRNMGEWFIITVADMAENSNKLDPLYVSPLSGSQFVDLEEAVMQINNFIVDTEHVGKYYKINISTPKYALIDINYRTPGQKYELDANITSTSLIVTIDPNRYGGTYLKTLRVYEADNNGTLPSEPLQFDSNNKSIQTDYSTQDDVIRYVFTYSSQRVRNLWFKYTDNFGIEYKENFILGIKQTPFENMLVFDNNYIKNESYAPISIGDISKESFDKYAEYYTSSNVMFEYQPKIFSKPTIYILSEENTWVDITEEYRINAEPNSNNVERISIFSKGGIGIGDDTYLIVFKDTAERNYQICVHNYTKIAELHFIDGGSHEHCFDIDADNYEFSISKLVYLSYEQVDVEASYPIKTTITAKRTYKNDENITITKDYGVIDDKFLFNEFGTYTITATNELGASKIYRFEYVKSDAIYYSVKANANGSTIFLSPSPVKHPTHNIDTYVSIYEMTVDVNQERNLKVEQDLSKSDLTTKVYRIYSDDDNFSYEKYIALTQIEKTSNLLQNISTITEYKTIDGEEETITSSIASKYVKSNAEKILLTLPSYNEFGIIDNSVNIIRVRIVYENKDLGIVNEYNKNEFSAEKPCKIELKTAGQYKIYVYDLAGNQHLFGNSEYLEISLINNFTYKLNGKKGLYNSIFNEKVSMFVEQRSNFVNDNNGRSYTISCTLNGEPYSPVVEKDSYIFNSYGTYNITLKGYLNRDASGSLTNEVVTNVKFTILNPNEARLMHEYIGLNGYEVTKIVKNNNDITEDIKSILNTSSINKFAISGLTDGIGGSGVYQITVKAKLDKIVGEAEFTYSVWINNDSDVLIIPSIAEGSKTTKKITLELNYYQIYSKIGECQLKINGVVYADINSASANSTATVTLSSNTRYNVTLETLSGNTISSLVVTKVEPLNSIAIIVIVVASVVVGGLTITFILFRKRMRVR